jgi:hypothetical protein
MKTYNHIMRAICSMPWAIQRSSSMRSWPFSSIRRRQVESRLMLN